MLPTALLVLPIYAVFARIAFVSTLRAGDEAAQSFKLRSALGALTLACGAMLLSLLLEGQVSMLALVAVPFVIACAASALAGYWFGAVVSRLQNDISS